MVLPDAVAGKPELLRRGAGSCRYCGRLGWSVFLRYIVVQVFGDSVLVTFLYDHDVEINGKRSSRLSRATYGFAKRGGKWWQVHDYSSAPLPMPVVGDIDRAKEQPRYSHYHDDGRVAVSVALLRGLLGNAAARGARVGDYDLLIRG
jgi:SnoaL-like domain